MCFKTKTSFCTSAQARLWAQKTSVNLAVLSVREYLHTKQAVLQSKRQAAVRVRESVQQLGCQARSCAQRATCVRLEATAAETGPPSSKPLQNGWPGR